MASILSKNEGFIFQNLKLELFYGEDQPKNNFIPHIIDVLSKNYPLSISQGDQKRDIIHIDDVIGSILWVVNNSENRSAEYLIGSGDLHSILETIFKVKTLLNSNSEIIFDSNLKKKLTMENGSGLKSVLDEGYKLKYSWEKGLESVVKSYIKNSGNMDCGNSV